jgi:hypothetical protein
MLESGTVNSDGGQAAAYFVICYGDLYRGWKPLPQIAYT